jgi:hypothetical protein
MMPEVNYLAIFVCGIVSLIFGSLWYGPLFGKMWQEMTGWHHLDAAKREAMKKGTMKSVLLALVASLVMAYILSHVITFASTYSKEAVSLGTGLQTAFWMWFGFVAPITVGGVLWEGKPWKLWIFNNAYHLIQFLIFGAILASWN